MATGYALFSRHCQAHLVRAWLQVVRLTWWKIWPVKDIPTETPLETGLRTSRDVRIPLDFNARQDEVRPNLRPSPRPNPRPSAVEEDAEINEQIRDIQTKEQETNTKQVERDTEIVEILLGIRAAEQAEDISREEKREPLTHRAN
ncbi:hypothetical protein F5882DRAFT_387013 [Hyaloscypha sp. PMI_1271]|nr:hypothetical protein F5882DRAFT_387013 [Hyaloscypha sp. PMI_1271]